MMRLVNPYFLLGLAGVAIPILIHLLTRDRVRKVAFSSLRFFAQASRTVLRRKRFAEMVLIAMRVLACALIAMIFARPFFTRGDEVAPGAVATAVAVVADVSASMGRSLSDDQLQGAILNVLDDLGARDGAAVITFDGAAHVAQPMTDDRDQLRTAVSSIRIGQGGTDIAAALDQARQLLLGVEAAHKRIVLISDLQRVGWESFNGTWRLPAGFDLAVHPIEPKAGAVDLAVAAAEAPQGLILDHQPRNITVRVANYSAADQRDVEVELEVAGKQVSSQRLFIPAGQAAPVRFSYVFDQPGDNPGLVRIKFDDAAPNDNLFYFNARVIPRIPILVLGSGTANRLNPAAFFVATALAPSDQSPFAVRTMPVGQATPADVEAASVVVLADTGLLPSALLKPLQDLLARGGGLLLLPGSNTQPDIFDSMYASLAPCKLRRVIHHDPAADASEAPGLARIDYTHPVFEVFLRPHYGDFTTVRFTRYWEVAGSQLAAVLARYDDGRPAILEQPIDAGLSMIWLSPVDMAWNNLPMRAIYLPMLHQCVRRLAVRTENRTLYTVGDRLPVPDDAAVAGPNGQALDPKDPTVSLPGFYEMTGPDQARFVFAVNTPMDEADAAVVDQREITAALEQPDQSVSLGSAVSEATLDGRRVDDHATWWYLLIVLMALLFGELYLGNRTARH